MSTTRVFLILALVLGCSERSAVLPKKLLPEEISAIDLATPNWARGLEKRGSRWFVVEGSQSLGPAKESTVARLLGLISLDRSKLPTLQSDLPCRGALTIRARGEGPEAGLTVCVSDLDGDERVSIDQGGRRYASVRDGASALLELTTTPRALEDRRIVPWNPDQVKEILVKKRNQVSRIERQGVLWQSPGKSELDASRIAKDLLESTLEPAPLEWRTSHPAQAEIVFRGLRDEIRVTAVAGPKRLLVVSNRPGAYRCSLSCKALDRLYEGK